MRLLDWIEAHDRHITSAAVAVLVLLGSLVVAGQAAIRL